LTAHGSEELLTRNISLSTHAFLLLRLELVTLEQSPELICVHLFKLIVCICVRHLHLIWMMMMMMMMMVVVVVWGVTGEFVRVRRQPAAAAAAIVCFESSWSS